MYAGLGRVSNLLDSCRDEFRDHMSLPTTYAKFGEWAVLVEHPGQFIRRIIDATRRDQYSCWYRAVHYYDPAEYDEAVLGEEVDAAFHKDRYFEDELEFRFAFRTNSQGDDALTLNIGPIDDIARLIPRNE